MANIYVPAVVVQYGKLYSCCNKYEYYVVPFISGFICLQLKQVRFMKWGVIKATVFCKVLCNHGKSKGSLVSKIPKLVQYGYDDSFKLMVIKYAKATSDCVTAWGLCVAKQSMWRLRKQTELLLKGANATQKTFCGPKHRKLNVVDKNTEGNFISAIASSTNILWWKVSWQQECWQWLAISLVCL